MEALSQTTFTEKDRFALADANTYDSPVKQKSLFDSNATKLQRYLRVDRVQKWGIDIRDPLAVRQLSDAEASDEEIIMTGSENK